MIIDVRTPLEFADGHVVGAVNIPLDQLERTLSALPKDRPLLVCCQRGVRSSLAEALLREHGYEAFDGGPWTSVAGITRRCNRDGQDGNISHL